MIFMFYIYRLLYFYDYNRTFDEIEILVKKYKIIF